MQLSLMDITRVINVLCSGSIEFTGLSISSSNIMNE